MRLDDVDVEEILKWDDPHRILRRVQLRGRAGRVHVIYHIPLANQLCVLSAVIDIYPDMENFVYVYEKEKKKIAR